MQPQLLTTITPPISQTTITPKKSSHSKSSKSLPKTPKIPLNQSSNPTYKIIH